MWTPESGLEGRRYQASGVDKIEGGGLHPAPLGQLAQA